MKTCRCCEQPRELEEFRKCSTARSGRRNICTWCESTKRKEWYRQRRAFQKAEVARRKQEIAEWFMAFKKTLKCTKCPENHPACMDFHHRDPATKLFTVTEGWRRGYSIERLLAEIEKCDVLCANCHRKLHWEIGMPVIQREFKNKAQRRSGVRNVVMA